MYDKIIRYSESIKTRYIHYALWISHSLTQYWHSLKIQWCYSERDEKPNRINRSLWANTWVCWQRASSQHIFTQGFLHSKWLFAKGKLRIGTLMNSKFTIHGRLARWIKWRACDVGEAKERLENELWRRWSNGRVGEWAATLGKATEGLENERCSFSYFSVTSPTSQLILQSFRPFT